MQLGSMIQSGIYLILTGYLTGTIENAPGATVYLSSMCPGYIAYNYWSTSHFIIQSGPFRYPVNTRYVPSRYQLDSQFTSYMEGTYMYVLGT